MPVLMVVLIAVVILIALPVAIIWSLNTLFALAIPFTFWTWLAALVLSGPFVARSSD